MAYAFLNGCEGKRAEGGSSYETEYAALIDGSVVNVVVPDGVSKIRGGIFSYAPYLVSVEIPVSVTVIERDAFLGSTAIKELVFPAGVTELAPNVASSCTALTSAVMLGDVNSVGETAFYNCPSCIVYDFTACTAVPTLQNVNAFNGINEAAKILVPGALYNEWKKATNWATYADYIEAVWDYTEGLAYEYDSDYGGAVVMGYGTWDAWSGEDLVIPPTCVIDGVEYNVVYIAYDAMQWGGMKTVRLPETIAVLNNGNFCYSSVTHLYIPFIRTVNSWCFSNQCDLKHVQFKDVEYIGDSCFSGCSGTVFDFTACTTVPTLDMEYYDPSYNFGTDPVFKVPASLLNEWKQATNWSMYADYIVAG